jgi:hypothetical protein
MSLSLSPPHLLTCSGRLLSLSLSLYLHCTWSSPLPRSPSVTALTTTPCCGSAPAMRRPDGRSDDHPTSFATAAPLQLPPHARVTAPTTRRRCGGRRSRGSPPTPLTAEVFLQASCPGCSRSCLFLEHIALGYFPVSELAVTPTTGAWARRCC